MVSLSPVLPWPQVYSPSQMPASPLRTSVVDGLADERGAEVVGLLDGGVVLGAVRTAFSAARGSPATGLPQAEVSTSSRTRRHLEVPRRVTPDIVPGNHVPGVQNGRTCSRSAAVAAGDR